ncbi:uncharacterized protein LOC135080466 [Ostrinia nubilalis]|uniref:uncharacterized protein LOC135080466 n=1 Tax=Ostrinia nubilalis TaxID=29057 RepID=UPI0030824782
MGTESARAEESTSGESATTSKEKNTTTISKIHCRPDRDITKKIITPGDYTVVPYEDSRCKIVITDVNCSDGAGPCDMVTCSRIFSESFDGNVLIGDCDSFIDKDFELALQQMCCGEKSEVTILYKDAKGQQALKVSCKVELTEVMEEQLVSDWSWERLHEAAVHHKERGVELVKEKRIVDAFRRFSKALKMLIAIEPFDPQVIDEEKVKELIDLKVKLYSNLAHCQLHYNQHEAAEILCTNALQFDPDNVKALYRRSLAFAGVKKYEEAWEDIQKALKLDPNDKAVKQKAKDIKDIMDNIKRKYDETIKKMFYMQE